MSLMSALFTGWHRVLAAFSPDDRQRLIESLCDAYHTETSAVAQFKQHAHRMYYPQFREGLLRIAAEAQAHIPWLQEKILASGGNLPQFSDTLKMGRNSWECLYIDLEEAQSGRINLLEWIHMAERMEPEIAAGLRRIRADKQQHSEEIRDMLMKSDPYTPPAIVTQQVQGEQEKHDWLEQRKGK